MAPRSPSNFWRDKLRASMKWLLVWYQVIGLNCLSGSSLSASTDCVTQSNVTRCCFNVRSCVTFWSSPSRQRSLNNQKENIINLWYSALTVPILQLANQKPCLLISCDANSQTWYGRSLGRIWIRWTPNRALVRFSGIPGSFGVAIGILAPQKSPGLPPKCAKKSAITHNAVWTGAFPFKNTQFLTRFHSQSTLKRTLFVSRIHTYETLFRVEISEITEPVVLLVWIAKTEASKTMTSFKSQAHAQMLAVVFQRFGAWTESGETAKTVVWKRSFYIVLYQLNHNSWCIVEGPYAQI